ncbi:hypothetical protein GUITHDRAFT_61274, partial [Guillardia theta CCMP2712]
SQAPPSSPDVASSSESTASSTSYIVIASRSVWSAEEHRRFLEALSLYGRAGRGTGRQAGRAGVGLGRGTAAKMAAYIGTKTSEQVRSHAQKHYEK